MNRSSDRTEKSLRKLAEEALKRNSGEDERVTPRDMGFLLHELGVHQVELETQNEELARAQQSLAESQRKYAYLYQFAPVGYFTLDGKGVVQEANVAGCIQLGVQRPFLIGKPFMPFVEKEDRRKFTDHRMSVFRSEEEQRCELRLLKNGKTPFWAELTSRSFQDDSEQASWLMIVTDISSRKAAECMLLQAHAELESLLGLRDAELSEAKAKAVAAEERRSCVEKNLSDVQKHLREITSHLHKAREEERKGLARDIHDELGQMLVAIKMDIGWIKKEYSDHSNLRDKLRAIDQTLGMSIKSVERLMSELRPVLLDHLGLAPAVDWYVKEFQKRTGIECGLTIHTRNVSLAGEKAIVLFRILQEALSNVARHAEAGKVRISIRRNSMNAVVLSVSDNGKGIGEAEVEAPGSFGIIGMRERVLSCDGEFEIRPGKDKGTIVTACIPIK